MKQARRVSRHTPSRIDPEAKRSMCQSCGKTFKKQGISPYCSKICRSNASKAAIERHRDFSKKLGNGADVAEARLRKGELEEWIERELDDDYAEARRHRPRTRAECVNGPRPCPWVSCKHNLSVFVTSIGRVVETGCPESCVLDVADDGPLSLQDIGVLLGLSRERIRQIEADAIRKIREMPEAERIRCSYEEAMQRKKAMHPLAEAQDKWGIGELYALGPAIKRSSWAPPDVKFGSGGGLYFKNSRGPRRPDGEGGA